MTTSDQPLSRETLDELLSADLDGELDRAAVDLGFTPAEARSMLAGAPDAASRRAALSGARDLLATQPALASEQELGLVAAAVDRATTAQRPPHSRSERRAFRYGWRVVVGAATAAAVVAGVVAVSASNPSSQSKSASLAAPALANGAPGNARAATVSITFGDITQSGVLLAKVRAHLSAVQNAPDALGPLGGTGLTGQHRTKGAQGPTGTFGGLSDAAGPIGATGPQGVTGPQGPAGPVGATGAQGEPGPAGPAGPVGPPGYPGSQYSTAVTGAQGGTGAPGPVGITTAAPDGVEGPADVNPPSATKSAVPNADAPLPGANGVAAGALQGAEGVLGPADGTGANRPTPAAVTLQTCVSRTEQQGGSGSTSVLSGTGSDAGRRVFVVVLPASGSYVVYVLSAADCTVITRTPLP